MIQRPFMRSVAAFKKLIGPVMGHRMLANVDFKEIIDSYIQKKVEVSIVVLRISSLSIDSQHINYIQVIMGRIKDFLSNYSPVIYGSAQGDLVIVCNKIDDPTIISGLQSNVRKFFAEDVLGSHYEQSLIEEFIIPKQEEEFFCNLNKIVSQEMDSIKPNILGKILKKDKRHRALNAPILADLEEIITIVDIGDYTSSQWVCGINKDTPDELKNADLEPTYREIYISTHKLQNCLAPSVDFLSNPWLFQHLTCLFDSKMFYYLMSTHSAKDLRHASINLNISSILTDEFRSFCNQFFEKEQLPFMIELQKVDVFNDIGAFHLARDCTAKYNIDLCIDNITYMILDYIDWQKLNVDYIKLCWDQSLAHIDKDSPIITKIKDFITDEKQPTVILSHCDCIEAINWGKSQGISFFQGWYVDKLMMPGFVSEAKASESKQ